MTLTRNGLHIPFLQLQVQPLIISSYSIYSKTAVVAKKNTTQKEDE